MNTNDSTLRSVADPKNMIIGAAVKTNLLRDDAQYRETVAREFNSITAEYEMKFQFMQPEQGKFDFKASDELMNFANQNDMDLRGHALVWHISNPEWLEKGNWSRQELMNILETHIKTVVRRYKGQIKVWDVVNEAVGDDGKLRNNIWLDKIGPEYIELAFKWAHEADPNAKLLYNDYRAEEVNQKSNLVYDIVSDLVAKGVPIHGVGFQMHMSEDDPRNFESVAQNMKRLGDLGLDVEFTEVDVRVKQPATAERLANQADIYQTIVELCAEADNCDSVTLWGVTDRYSWIPDFFNGYDDALIFDENYQAKEAYDGLLAGLEGASTQNPKPTPEPTPEPDPTPDDDNDMDDGDMGDSNDNPQDENTDDLGDGDTPDQPDTGDYDIVAGDGNDSINLGKNDDSVDAGNGNNKIYVESSDNSPKKILTGNGNDKVHAGAGDDYLDLGTAQDYDVAFGKGGNDTFVVNQGSGYLSIRDFEKGADKFKLNGLEFDDIEQSSRNGKTWLSAAGDTLVELTDFTETLTEEDFESSGSESPADDETPDDNQDIVDESPVNDEDDNQNPDTGGDNPPVEDSTGDYDIITGDENDVIRLSEGQNSVNAGHGNNKIYVDSSSSSFTSDKDVLTGIGNDKAYLGAGNDRIDLGVAPDYDVAFGGDGSDTFVVNQGSGYLIIRDFEKGTDLLELSDGLNFGALEQASRNGKTWLGVGNDTLVELTDFSATLTAADFTTTS